jgi:hypothetical protein
MGQVAEEKGEHCYDALSKKDTREELSLTDFSHSRSRLMVGVDRAINEGFDRREKR